jgi:hypothetical protein
MINLFFLNDFLFQFILILGATNLFMYSLSAYYVYFNDKTNIQNIIRSELGSPIDVY